MWPFIRRPSKRSARQRCSLGLEPLEARCLLDAAPVTITPPSTTIVVPVLPPSVSLVVATPPAPARFTAAELEQFFLDEALARYGSLFGGPAPDPRLIVFQPPLLATSAAAGQGATGSAFSPTNVQTPGVDEGDLVKTDGGYLYVVSGQELFIISAGPEAKPSVVSRTKLEGTFVAEYLDGDRLTVLTQEYAPLPYLGPLGTLPVYPPQKTQVKVTVFDVSDRTSPRAAVTTSVDGYAFDSRDVGGRVYLVVRNDYAELPPPVYSFTGQGYTYETREQYVARHAGRVLDEVLPHYHTGAADLAPGEVPTLLVQPQDVYRPEGNDHTSFFSLLVFDPGRDEPGPAASLGFLGDTVTAIYASKDNLYLVSLQASNGDPVSLIRKVPLDGGPLSVTAVGVVPEAVTNRFALDESNGYLRVATTTGYGEEATSNVYVLAQAGDALTVVGRLEGLATGDYLAAVRFAGDRGYLATSSQTSEPTGSFQVLDLSDPSAPRLAGRVPFAGTSFYLQPLDATHLLGIGRQADAAGNGSDLQLSLYDTADPSHPRLVDQYVIAGAFGTYSEAEYDRHALFYSPQDQTLVLPVSGTIAYPAAQVALMYVFHVDLTTGFRLEGRIQHDTSVRRSLRIDDRLYTVSGDAVQVHPLDQPDREVAMVPLVNPDLQGSGTTITATAGQEFSSTVASFPAPVDPSPVYPYGSGLLDHAVVYVPPLIVDSIDWGDGQVSGGFLLANGQGGYDVSGTHVYAQPGTYTVTVKVLRGDQLGLATSTAQVTDPVPEFVDRVYRDLLQHAPDADGQHFWTDRLHQGAARGQLVQALLNSVEYRTLQTESAFQSILNRPADQAGLAAALQFLAAGGTLESLRSSLFGSAEYSLRSGGSTGGFLDALYRQVLGRPIDAAGAVGWGSALALGVPRPFVAEAIQESAEGEQVTAAGMFREFLHREITGPELAALARQGGSRAEQLLAMVLGSEEYLGRP
jgi:uncharacterized secreted protein with C-terminal beta-propeller domain